MIRLTLLGESTVLLSTLCASCPQGPAGCCVAPPEYDWSDIGRVVRHGGRDWLLDQIAARRVEPVARGLAVRRVRKREARDLPRQSKCAFHGPRGCTITPEQRPETCNYFLCDDAFREGGEARGDRHAVAARRAHGTLRAVYERWDATLAAAIPRAWPEGFAWDAAFLDWLGAEVARLATEAHAELAAIMPGAEIEPGAMSFALSLDPDERSAMIPRMSKITLKLRDLHNGNTSFKELADEDAALAYLRERPRFTEVLGVVFEGLTPEQNTRLKEANRPLDAEEQAAETRLDEAATRAAEAAQAKRAKEEDAARAAHREAMKKADPNRPMEVRYRFDGSITPVDPEDQRPITDEARAAILAWVAERNEWVEARNQCVGEAKMQVWLGALPRAGADRVQGGSFIPVAAAPKTT
ncbi:Hypothetical protein A7982_04657 [Minicystis rosea]|nr:Hypothetical protein A7982_04657 [Minicystis rosea]